MKKIAFLSKGKIKERKGYNTNPRKIAFLSKKGAGIRRKLKDGGVIHGRIKKDNRP